MKQCCPVYVTNKSSSRVTGDAGGTKQRDWNSISLAASVIEWPDVCFTFFVKTYYLTAACYFAQGYINGCSINLMFSLINTVVYSLNAAIRYVYHSAIHKEVSLKYN
jgi:hypothetical protein